MEEVIDWHSIPRGSAFTFVGMPSDVDIVYYLGRSLVTPLIAILESESGAIYKKPLAVLRHWPEHDKRAQPAVDDALAQSTQSPVEQPPQTVAGDRKEAELCFKQAKELLDSYVNKTYTAKGITPPWKLIRALIKLEDSRIDDALRDTPTAPPGTRGRDGRNN